MVQTREEAIALSPSGDKDEILRHMEQLSLLKWISNLQTYDVVQEALREKNVTIHGWVLDTATSTAIVMNQETKVLGPMTPEYAHSVGLDIKNALKSQDGPVR